MIEDLPADVGDGQMWGKRPGKGRDSIQKVGSFNPKICRHHLHMVPGLNTRHSETSQRFERIIAYLHPVEVHREPLAPSLRFRPLPQTVVGTPPLPLPSDIVPHQGGEVLQHFVLVIDGEVLAGDNYKFM